MNLMLNKDTLKYIVLRSWVGRVFFFIIIFQFFFIIIIFQFLHADEMYCVLNC